MTEELIAAVRAGDAERVHAVVAGSPELAEARDADGVSVLMLALYHGHEDVAEAIRAARRSLDGFEAAALGDVEQLRAVLDADPSFAGAWSPDGFTSLHFAAFFGRVEAARLLVERGADLEAPAREHAVAPGARPLHSAAAAGRVDVARVLLELGVDPNATQRGFVALDAAVENGDEPMQELLRSYGARPGRAAGTEP